MAHLSLPEAYNRAPYPAVGHGPRTVSVLKEALASVDDTLAADLYGQGRLIADFQRKMADYLGKPAAVFFPSGTMAQQIALRIWCDKSGQRRVAYHPLCHLEIHEQHGMHELHHLEPVLLGDAKRLIGLNDLEAMPEGIGAVLLELPQREIGGELPQWDRLVELTDWCRSRNIPVHLDGARLYECLPYYAKSAAEVAALFDSIYVSFYKGVGGVAGAILAGPDDFTSEAVVWKRRHGGDLISLYPYIVAADYYFDRRVSRMAEYWQGARELAGRFNHLDGVRTRPERPVTNMFHVHFHYAAEEVGRVMAEVAEETGVGLLSRVVPLGEARSYAEVSVGDLYAAVPKERLDWAFREVEDRLTHR